MPRLYSHTWLYSFTKQKRIERIGTNESVRTKRAAGGIYNDNENDGDDNDDEDTTMTMTANEDEDEDEDEDTRMRIE